MIVNSKGKFLASLTLKSILKNHPDLCKSSFPSICLIVFISPLNSRDFNSFSFIDKSITFLPLDKYFLKKTGETVTAKRSRLLQF